MNCSVLNHVYWIEYRYLTVNDMLFLCVWWWLMCRIKFLTQTLTPSLISIYEFSYACSLPTPDIGKCVLDTSLPETPRRHTMMRYQRTWYSSICRIIYFSDFQHNYSGYVQPALACKAWKVSRDLLKSGCGRKMFHEKTNSRIWAIQAINTVVLVDTHVKQLYFTVNIYELTLL